jgi:hypothetical protein
VRVATDKIENSVVNSAQSLILQYLIDKRSRITLSLPAILFDLIGQAYLLNKNSG